MPAIMSSEVEDTDNEEHWNKAGTNHLIGPDNFVFPFMPVISIPANRSAG